MFNPVFSNDNFSLSFDVRKIKNRERINKKRQKNKKIFDEIAIISNPEKYLFSDTSSNTVAKIFAEYSAERSLRKKRKYTDHES